MKILNNITSWIGWLFIFIADHVGHGDGDSWDESDEATLRNRVAEKFYNVGCDLYGAFDNE